MVPELPSALVLSLEETAPELPNADDCGSPVWDGMKESLRIPAGIGSNRDCTRSQVFPWDISVLFFQLPM